MELRQIKSSDNQALEFVLRSVMVELGLTGEGCSIHDDEMSQMAETYSQPRYQYYVLVDGERIVGGGGIGPLLNGDKSVCELKKMYFLPESRGKGFGKKLVQMLLESAKTLGYRQCYLETMKNMTSAVPLYENEFGFRRLERRLGDTGHHACEIQMVRDL